MVDYGEIKLWGKTMGYLTWNNQRGVGVFQYDPDFLRLGLNPAPLSMPSSSSPHRIFTFDALPFKTFKGLPPMLSDSLPDDFGNAIIDAWLTRNGRDPETCSPLERLLYIGTRGMGALEYAPAKNAVNEVADIELDDLVSVINDLLNKRSSFSEQLDLQHGENHEALQSLFRVGTSAGGARPKALVAMNDQGHLRSGQVEAPEGYEHWMLKFDGIDQNQYQMDNSLGFGQIEYVYHLMAVSAGITMMECKLLHSGKLRHFMTKRFDRLGSGGKVHMQTLCAMDRADYKKPGAYSYEQLFSVMRKLRLSRAEAIEQYRRMVFNVVSRNQDDHTKNVTFLMDRKGRWSLSPAYDVTWSYKKDSEWVSQHQMTINGKRDDFTREDLLMVAKQINGFKEANDIIDEVIEAVSQWRTLATEHEVRPEHIDAIESTHRVHI